jgi:hypothetical protein
VYGVPAEGLSIDQTAWERLVIGVLLDDLSLDNANEDFIEREMIGLGFSVSVIRNPHTIVANGVDDVFDLHWTSFLQPSISGMIVSRQLVNRDLRLIRGGTP